MKKELKSNLVSTGGVGMVVKQDAFGSEIDRWHARRYAYCLALLIRDLWAMGGDAAKLILAAYSAVLVGEGRVMLGFPAGVKLPADLERRPRARRAVKRGKGKKHG